MFLIILKSPNSFAKSKNAFETLKGHQMTFINQILAKTKAKPRLNWISYDGEDLEDAIEHCDLVRRRQMSKQLGEIEEVDEKEVNPEKLLPKEAFNGKKKGWLLEFPEEQWPAEFQKVYGRDLKKILELSKGEEGIPSVIVIEGILGDGYARTKLCYSLGEKVHVVYFEEVKEDESGEEEE